jgi:hypothetical protein
LKKGKSRVIEEGHHLILGWNDKLLPLIHELAVANESEGGGVIVILAEKDKEEMEEEISSVFDEKALLGMSIEQPTHNYQSSAQALYEVGILLQQPEQQPEQQVQLLCVVMAIQC